MKINILYRYRPYCRFITSRTFIKFLISKRLKDYGHNPILLVGGGTGLIGDPRPTAERDTIVKEELFRNTECLKIKYKDYLASK